MRRKLAIYPYSFAEKIATLWYGLSRYIMANVIISFFRHESPPNTSEPMSGSTEAASKMNLAARLGDKQEELVTNLKIVTFCYACSQTRK